MSEHAQLMVRDIRGPFSQLLVNLSGDNGQEWLNALQWFLRKENPWSHCTDTSILDKLIKDVFTSEVVMKQGIKNGRRVISDRLALDQILTIGDLVKLSERELFRIPFFGKKYVGVIKEVLAGYGLHLAND